MNSAIASLSRAASLDPRLAEAHSLLAVAYDRKGLHDRARESYDRAVDVNENDAQALNNLGYSLYLNGNYRAAVDKLKKAAKLAPGDGRILNNLALAQARLGKYDDAYRNFARAGGEFNGHANVAALLIRAGREEKAVEHLEQARRLQPDAQNVLRQLAEAYERAGRGDRAGEARETLAAIDARQAVAAAAAER
jgi:Flp pilus assembly protein TadD